MWTSRLDADRLDQLCLQVDPHAFIWHVHASLLDGQANKGEIGGSFPK